MRIRAILLIFAGQESTMSQNPTGNLVLRAAIDALPGPLFIVSSEGACLGINSAARELLGCSQFSGMPVTSFWPAFPQSKWATGEAVAEFRDSTGRALSAKLSVHASDVLVVRVLATTSADAEPRMFQVQRLEALGLLAGAVAHDFNNVLTGILGHCTYLKTILPGAGAHAESLKAIEDGAQKASSMTQQIVRFSKLGEDDEAGRIDLVDLTERTCTLLRGAIPTTFTFSWETPEEPVIVMGNESKFAQVVINLVVNARDALSPGGNVRLHLTCTSDKSEFGTVFANAEPLAAKYALLSVFDDGHGMSPEVRERIFEPYFSTKKDRGTGLGLATTLSIVSSLGGAIDVESVAGRGSLFRVFLPMIDEDQTGAGRASSDEVDPVRGRGERILIVDDEHAVRNVLSMSLEHLGYQVETAASGGEALDRFANQIGKFDLVILDMLMPHMSGEELFIELKRISPDVRVLLVSGFSAERSVESVLKSGGRDYIQKPFTVEVLSRKVRRCLDD